MSDLCEKVFSTIMESDPKKAFLARMASHEQDVHEYRAMSDAEFAMRMEYYFGQMRPCEWPKGTPVYDAVMQHVMIPEAIRRLKGEQQ